jgi:ATP-dependent DNA helicase RecQ
MKMSEKNGNYAVSCYSEEDLSEMAVPVLKTAILTNGRYGMTYLVQLLIGDVEMKFRKPEHGSLETFGSLMNLSHSRVREFMCFLIRKGLLYQSAGDYPLVRASRKGLDFLQNPVALSTEEEKVFSGKTEMKLRYRLVQLRWEIAAEEKKSLLEIFSEPTLQHLCMAKPGSSLELLMVHGIGPWKERRYGHRILEVIKSFRKEEKKRAVTRVFKSVYRPTFQETKVLFEQGMDTSEIASRKGLKESTVKGHLEKLHLCGEIDIRAWIEKQVDRSTLHRAIRYFREAEDQSLRTAHEVLGLEMKTLHLCRLYMQPPAALKQFLVA